jgi:hypothetical protein
MLTATPRTQDGRNDSFSYINFTSSLSMYLHWPLLHNKWRKRSNNTTIIVTAHRTSGRNGNRNNRTSVAYLQRSASTPAHCNARSPDEKTLQSSSCHRSSTAGAVGPLTPMHASCVPPPLYTHVVLVLIPPRSKRPPPPPPRMQGTPIDLHSLAADRWQRSRT